MRGGGEEMEVVKYPLIDHERRSEFCRFKGIGDSNPNSRMQHRESVVKMRSKEEPEPRRKVYRS